MCSYASQATQKVGQTWHQHNKIILYMFILITQLVQGCCEASTLLIFSTFFQFLNLVAQCFIFCFVLVTMVNICEFCFLSWLHKKH